MAEAYVSGANSRQPNDIEAEIFYHLQEAGNIASRELESDINLNNIQTKSYHIRKAAEAAEQAGWPKKEISKRLLELIFKHDYNISRSLVYRICSPLGYSESDSELDQSSPMIGQENSSIYTAFEQENEQLITQIEKEIDIKKAIISKLRTSAFLTKIPREERKELLYCYAVHNKNIGMEWDGRKDVSERQYFILYEASTAAINDKVTELYIKMVKDWKPLTGKQYHKLKVGITRMIHPLFEPKNQQEAIDRGFYGIQCRCGSWRVLIEKEPTKEFKVQCCKCQLIFEPKTETFSAKNSIILDEKINTVLTNYDDFKKNNGY